jgi:EAL domain-containing protein (putative c-di-GMP-specific phosphodiesterase class I)
MGIAIAVDDFGTGYSSLRYLSSLPIDSLKIGSSFITKMAASKDMKSITESTIVMAHSLHMPVIAEGVSTREQLDFLAARGCNQIQGYLCSPPLPPDELEIFLDSHHPENPFPKQP